MPDDVGLAFTSDFDTFVAMVNILLDDDIPFYFQGRKPGQGDHFEIYVFSEIDRVLAWNLYNSKYHRGRR